MSDLQIILTLLVASTLGVVIPWVGARMLARTLRDSERATTVNYAGSKVFLGLGAVWLIWAGCAVVGGVLAAATMDSTTPLIGIAGALAVVAFALGLLDDAYGDSSARGFRGHIKALLSGRLTTGGMKLVGISVASLFAALVIGPVTAWGTAIPSGAQGMLAFVGSALLAGAAIALTSNFVNLTDLRPGRALKTYSVLAALGVVSCAWLLGTSAIADEAGLALIDHLLDTAVIGLFAYGPVLAVWRYDLRGEGMLGDAGANPMGAVAGLLIVSGLPLWGVAVWFFVMLALNIVSERVSFTKVIEGSKFLSWADGLGRADASGSPPPRDKSGTPESG